MKALVYLFEKKGIYKIGHSKDIKTTIKQIKPDKVIASLEVDQPENFEARLFRRYRKSRLTGSDYFKLDKEQVVDCIKQLGDKSQIPKNIDKEFSIAFTASVLFFIPSFFILSWIHLGIIKSMAIAFALSSLSFWTLFFAGSFGGYYSSDLPLFSAWQNRTKAVLFASGLTGLAISILTLGLKY